VAESIMGFRTIVIKNRCKLSYSLNYLVYRGEEDYKINLNEITSLIIESTAVSITTSLISELSDRKINVIFCNSKHNPEAQLIPLYNSHNSFLKIQEQISWGDNIKGSVWKRIVEEKIVNQAANIDRYCEEKTNRLKEYKNEVLEGDLSNREGHAAKVYFNLLFGKEFTRGSDCFINAVLNYGYTILLSMFNRAIISYGYLTQIGIHHKNEYNSFNLSCDLIEPFRPIIDNYALSGLLNESNFKKKLNDIGSIKMIIKNQKTDLENSIKLYCSSVFRALNEKDSTLIDFFNQYEL